jgi:hypothetical protein
MPLSPVVSIVVTTCFPWHPSVLPVLRRPANADVLDQSALSSATTALQSGGTRGDAGVLDNGL